MHQLILGGARSGKSRLAEQRALQLAEHSGGPLFYLATATAGDDEMAERIAHHRQRRSDQWQLLEEPLTLIDTLRANDGSGHVILVDCLTLWLSNCLHHQCWQAQRDSLLQGLANLRSQVIFVSNEVGSGVVPLGQLSRQFVDESGFLHQALAQQCQQVTLTVAGLPLELKQP
ncbi:bifunctional adenosylcobinamide kinase/adenosylcobinamide-phosphate guanylyltransferase [Porticoccus sp. W117]|uniref:bifunctional adenosylcobinamide kinase/adenosylcobinamide-phosphate guanylyltransferase n=1 Tax=Porticoccus sp. W117 TaxID=3054777 RepID=UPI00259753D1|nr:bifunctional adenosylcobinamide kinase/adenosylcobinamide-phosphate guanylyltransferase [Porticoccus sp. W117]MDM3871416.1 bifunctional adenosylcobinamide kinase/adenosylcobinamide-phosphate guanylyltransferase [Porticoccus sp. W117]